jgi:hypothetical protein
VRYTLEATLQWPYLKLHSFLYRHSGGFIGSRFLAGRALLLTTTGRRSAELRTTALIYVRDGDRLVVVASNGGSDRPGPVPIGLGAATDLFCAAKAAEGASPRTVEWYQMILVRAVRRFGEETAGRRHSRGRAAGLAARAAGDACARIDRRLHPRSEGLRQLVRGQGGRDRRRRLTDDTADLLAALLTRGRVTSDLAGPHTDYLAEFPYLGPPHPHPIGVV